MSIPSTSHEAGTDPKLRRRKATRPDVPMEELPHHSEEVERALLGCLLYDAPLVRERLDGVRQAGLIAEWFYDLRHQVIFHNIERLAATLPEAAHIDLIILFQRLRESGELDQIGDVAYLNACQDSVPGAANIAYYLDILREKWLVRRSLALVAEASMEFKESSPSVDAALQTLQDRIERLADQSVPRSSHLAKVFMPAVIDGIEDYHRGHAQMRGIPTGLDYVDKMVCGLGGLNTKMNIIAGRPSTGKTALALDIAQHVACDASWFKPLYNADFTRKKDEKGESVAIHMTKTPVGIFSFEMTSLALVDRLVFQRARADKQQWRNGFAVDGDLPPLVKASTEIEQAPIHIDDVPCTAEQLCAKARQMHRQHGIELFIIDYIQLIYSQKDFRGDRVQELAYISRLLTLTAKALNVPFIVLAQMNRDSDKEPNRDPRLSDLKDSGALEQDGDLIAFLHEPKLSDDKKEKWETQRGQEWPAKGGEVDWRKAPRRINLLIAKYRNGPTGACELLFFKSCMHFEDYNKWEVAKGYKKASAGEVSPRQQPLIDDEEVPNEN